jgi:hypothetical protein
VRAEFLSLKNCQVLHFELSNGQNVFILPILPERLLQLDFEFVDHLSNDINPDGLACWQTYTFDFSKVPLFFKQPIKLFINPSSGLGLRDYADHFFKKSMESEQDPSSFENLRGKEKEVKKALKVFLTLFLTGSWLDDQYKDFLIT